MHASLDTDTTFTAVKLAGVKHTLSLLAALALSPSVGVLAQQAPLTPIEKQARNDFAGRMGGFNEKGDWQALVDNGREWQKSNPSDPNGWWTEAWGAYHLGNVDTAIAAWQRGDEMDPSNKENTRPLLERAQKVKANFPNLKLKPLEFVEGDAVREQLEWQAKGAELLAAKKYDEIEKTAQELQKSNASNAKGTPHLEFFFNGLCGKGDSLAQRQSRIAAWRTARPKSELARVASVQLWIDEAWNARGDGMASTITPQMSAKMDEYLEKAFNNLKQWPQTTFSSPLAFVTAVSWAQLAGPPQSFMNGMFERGEAQFPRYLPLIRLHAFLLMPRWFGEAGDAEKFVGKKADAVGGEEGDILYARIVWTQILYYGNIWKETSFSYDRFKKGMEALAAKKPNSVSAANAAMRGAVMKGDDQVVKAFFASPNGHLIDKAWWSEKQRVLVPSFRMEYLAK